MTAIGNQQSPIGNASPVSGDNPWPGLESFTEDARGFFFGREKETDELSRLVRRQTLTVLFGQSGLGKSSLLQAGLFPILRETDHLPLYLRLDHAPMAASLVSQVKLSLNAAFVSAKADAPAFSDDETLWEYFHRKDIDIWSAKNRLLTPVLAFDQFEEIFTLGRADEACRERSRAFLKELACLVENRPPPAVKARLDAGTLDPARFNFEKPSCQVILSLREDFLPDLESLKQEMPALIHNRLRLKKLNGTQALEVVTRPAPHLLAEGVAERIVEFVAGARGGSAERLAELDVEPPLLSVICRELNERRRVNGAAQITADLVSGNRREILTDFYERSVADLPEAMRAFVEDHLLTKSGFRDNLALESALEFPGVTRPLLDTLVARRLLRIEDRFGVQRVELTHDVLAEVIRGSRDARQQRLLLAADRRRSRRTIVGLSLVVAGLLVGAFFGIRAQRGSARQASQTDVVLASRLLDEGKISEGIAYLVRAGRKDPTNPLVAPRLLSALSSHRYLLPITAPVTLPSPAIGGTFLPDGRSLLFVGKDRIARLVDTTTWTVDRDLKSDPRIKEGGARAFAIHVGVFAAELEDGSILVFDRDTGQPRCAPIRLPEPIFRGRGDSAALRLSPDGRWLATRSADQVRVWDAQTGELRATLPGTGPAAFSPDSRLIAMSRDEKIFLWSLAEQKFIGQPVGFESSATALRYGVWYYAFSADSRRLLIKHWNGATVCDTSTGLPVAPVLTMNNFQFEDTLLSQDGTKAIWSHGDEVEVLDVATGSRVYPSLKHGGSVRQIILVDDGRILFTNSTDGAVRLWDLATGTLLAEPTVRQPRSTPAAVSEDGQSVVLFTGDGRLIPLRLGGRPAGALALARDPGTTFRTNVLPDPPARVSWLAPTSRKAIDVASGKVVAGGFPYPQVPVNISNDSYTAYLGAPGQVLIAEMPSKELRLWTLGENGVAKDVLLADPPDYGDNSSFAIDSARQRVAWPLGRGASPRHNLLGIWDTQSGRRVATIDAGSPITLTNSGIVFSPDGRRVAFRTLQDGLVHVCEIGTGKDVFTLQTPGSVTLTTHRYTSGGQRILSGDNEGGVHVWDAASGALLRSSYHHRASVPRLDYSPDRRFYSSMSVDGSAQVWDTANDEPVGPLLEQIRSGGRANFSPDGTRIVMPSMAGAARVWDVQTGLPVTELNREDDQAGLAVITPDGRFVVSNPGSNTAVRSYVRVMAMPPSDAGRTPDWLLTLGTICAESRLTDEGRLVGAMDEFAKIADVHRALASAPADDPYAEWGRWILSERPDRSIAPGFTITPAEAAERAKETPSADGW